MYRTIDNGNRTRDNGFKLKEYQFRWDIRGKIFTVRVVTHWHELPRGVVHTLCLEILKVWSDRALNKLIYLKMSLLRS